MLPAAKALLVTVLLGGGTVGTYALAGGKFGTGGSSDTTAQVSTNETTTPAADGQARSMGAALADTTSSEPQDGDASVAIASTDGGKDTGSTDASASPRVEPEIRSGEETISAEGQQRDSQKEAVPADDGQAPAKPETPGIGVSDTVEAKTNPVGGSNEPLITENAGSDSQKGKQNSEAEGGRGVQENGVSQSNQIAGDSPSANTGKNGQPSDAPAPQNTGDTGSVNQTDITVTADPNTNAGGSSQVGQAQA